MLGTVTAVAATVALVAPAQAAPAKPTPAPFPVTDLARLYASDISSHPGGVYLQPIDSFTALRRDHPEVMARNLETAVAVNQAAADKPALQRRALADAHDDPLWTMSDAFGEQLGRHFRAALTAGRLPKTTALFSDYLARAGGLANATFVEKYVFGYDRPFIVAPERIRKYMRAGASEYDALGSSPSFPSGHTSLFFWRGTLLASMLPELGPQFLTRASEGGYHRIVLGVHYPLDVIGGAIVGQAAAADRRNDPAFRRLLDEASTEIRRELEWRCSAALSTCIGKDTPYASDADAQRIYEQRLTYGFGRVSSAAHPMAVPQQAIDLIATAFPRLTVEQRRQVLEQTAHAAGYPLDDQRPGRSSWQRLDLVRAYNAEVTVNRDGNVTVG
ncbi:phosphatase PAP2 family protein [Gordonia jinghuaiqii]|uniref:Phosphatase PAP2 family protein n=1 Tax=Gordonia jinghuaiqii TaxID=2758710 RepID=A0A7D7REC6_9ACTN|nr:phosphatase PAP2 family protein [Gordonia jinghuaiqii]MCR5978308.1 phosphatase PAP2 family protein [Gordonia jinghuaiqii]QMT04050.1 phosphatase PAP2 family protein [Gordonia jinghuaiqii]